jgi:hypothetical protein
VTHRIRTDGAKEFAAFVEMRGPWGKGPLDRWHREELAAVLGVSDDAIEDQLVLWLIDKQGAQGPREALVITRDLRYIRMVGRGGRQVIDLGTGNRL